MPSHEKVFRLRETPTFGCLEFLLVSGPRNRSSRARETSTSRNTQQSTCNLVGASSLRSRPGPDSLWKPKKKCATLRPNAFFSCDARPRPPAADYECSDKVHPFDKVSSRVRETLTFRALKNSKRGKCRLARTKHPLLSILELRISILTRETCPSSCRDSDSLCQASGRSLVG